MAADYILLDTCVLSDARKESPHPAVLEFILSLRSWNVAIASPSVFELERGALDVERQDPALAIKRSLWLEKFLATNLYFIPVNSRVAQLLARMSLCPPLKEFWAHHSDAKRLKFGSDPAIAAISIVHEIPIATSDIRDYLRINEHFPIPGLYDPRTDEWHLEPPVGWGIEPPANSNVRDDNWSDLFPSRPHSRL